MMARRRSKTIDLGYRHNDFVGPPPRRGPWGQPQIVPGPGAAPGNVNSSIESPKRGVRNHAGGAEVRCKRGSQDDSVLQGTELPKYGRDLAADGMLEFEEMMARRVRMFQGVMRTEHR